MRGKPCPSYAVSCRCSRSSATLVANGPERHGERQNQGCVRAAVPASRPGQRLDGDEIVDGRGADASVRSGPGRRRSGRARARIARTRARRGVSLRFWRKCVPAQATTRDRRTGAHGFLRRSGGGLEDGEREGRRQARNPERKLLRNPQREMMRTEFRKASAIPFAQVTRRKERHVCGSADGNPQLLSLQLRKRKGWAAAREVGGKSPQFRLLRAPDWARDEAAGRFTPGATSPVGRSPARWRPSRPALG